MSKIPKSCQVTRSDVTKLPEESTSVYGAGSSFGIFKKLDRFFGLLEVNGVVGAEP